MKHCDVYKCKICKKEYDKVRYVKNKENICNASKIYRTLNEFKIKDNKKIYYINNKGKLKEKVLIYRLSNKDAINVRNCAYERGKRKNDFVFKLRRNISSLIRYSFNKNRQSYLKYIPYNIFELKTNLESKFEPWMNWDNYGVYRIATWDDNNQSTWTWNIDHIIPQSDLPYTSMEDENFKKCWSLNNLRPYSAKLNLLDGVNKIRHKGALYAL